MKGTPIPRAEAQEIVDWLLGVGHSSPMLMAEQVFVGGSFCRNHGPVGDIDIALLAPYSIAPILAHPAVKKNCNGNEVKSFDLPRKSGGTFQLDLWICNDPLRFGLLCMFVTGNAQCNVLQRQLARKQGYILSHKSITTLDGTPVQGDFSTQQQVYQFFGWPWWPFSHREQIR